MTQNSQLLDIISDPILGPFEGEDFCIDEQGYIQVYDHNPKVAAMIMRKANTSGLFPVNLVKVAHKGDAIILGFDTVSSTEPVFVNQIGYQKGDQDPSTWMPPENKCLYVSNWIAIKVRYSLTVDSAEANALTSLVTQCNITSITAFSLPAYAVTAGINPITLVSPTPAPTPTQSIAEPTPAPTPAPKVKKAVKYSTCAKARAAGVTPIVRSKDKTLYALNKALDRDKDGVACE